jgi:hypothetical protein
MKATIVFARRSISLFLSSLFQNWSIPDHKKAYDHKFSKTKFPWSFPLSLKLLRRREESNGANIYRSEELRKLTPSLRKEQTSGNRHGKRTERDMLGMIYELHLLTNWRALKEALMLLSLPITIFGSTLKSS